jgi:DNA sulfur modification protein DndD
MILDSVTLKNIGTFLGEHRVELRPERVRKPVVLIGALNGSGKTTLIEALQLGLYGKRAAFGWRGQSSYGSFLEQMKNHYSKSTDDMMVEIELTLGARKRFRIRRQWRFGKGDPREFLSVFLDGSDQPDIEMSELWDAEIETVMPARLSQLFFFDGEKIETLANPAKSADVIKSAVSALLGLDAVDSLIADLEILRNRQKSAYLTDVDRAQVDALETQKSLVMDSLSALERDRASKMSSLDHVLVEEQGLKEATLKSGGDLYEQREQIEKDLSAINSLLAELESQLRKHAAGVLPLGLVRTQLEQILETMERAGEISDHVAASKIREYLARLDSWLSRFSELTPEVIEIRKHVTNERSKFETTQELGWIGSYLPMRDALRRLLEVDIPSSQREVRDISERLEGLRAHKRLIEHNRSRLPEPEQIVPLLKKLGAVQERVSSLRCEIESINHSIGAKRKDIAKLGQDAGRVMDRTREANDALRVAEYCDRSIETLKIFRLKLIEARRSELQKLIVESFLALIRKPDLVERISIDPETMGLTLFGPGGLLLSPAKLSAGERQLLAVSILWGLAKASGRMAPVVIDTPLGRLDGDHRDYLVERYFPKASRQVVLLSTDKEIGRRYSDLMDDWISKRYLISYDPKTKTSGFTEGYFRRNVA